MWNRTFSRTVFGGERVNYIMKEKYIGALLGAAIGDALGWPNEQNSKNINRNKENIKSFISWIRKGGVRYWPYEERINAGEYSDDTQLIIATMRSILRGKQWSNYFRQIELPAWFNYERGGGGATKRAAKKWISNISPWDEKNNSPTDIKKYYLAGGNGVAMRIIPHVFENENDVDKIMFQVVLNGMYTHGHPRALIGAMLYACAVRRILLQDKILGYGELIELLLDEKDIWGKLPEVNNVEVWKEEAKQYADYEYDIIWKECVDETINYLKITQNALNQGILDIGNETLEQLGGFNSKINGAGNLSATISIYLFSKYASDPVMALYETANLKNSDTDTLASLVGGLVGSLNGCDWIPVELRGVQDYKVFEYLVEQKINRKCDFLDNDKQYQLFDVERLLGINIGESAECLPFGKITLMEIRDEKVNREGMYAKTYIWKTQYGQTIFSKKIGKNHTVNENNTKRLVIENKEQQLNGFLINKEILSNIKNILDKVTNANDFVEILCYIMQMRFSEDLSKGTVDELKEKWKKYRLTKKQIVSVYKILS